MILCLDELGHVINMVFSLLTSLRSDWKWENHKTLILHHLIRGFVGKCAKKSQLGKRTMGSLFWHKNTIQWKIWKSGGKFKAHLLCKSGLIRPNSKTNCHVPYNLYKRVISCF